MGRSARLDDVLDKAGGLGCPSKKCGLRRPSRSALRTSRGRTGTDPQPTGSCSPVGVVSSWYPNRRGCYPYVAAPGGEGSHERLVMYWVKSHRCDVRALRLADRHYSRQSPGTPNFVQNGRNLVLLTENADAVWVSSWPEYQKWAWSGAWICAMFRNEGPVLSSILIREAIAATRYYWGGPPAIGMVTTVDPGKTRRKRDPGRCFRKAGFVEVGTTKVRKLVVLQLLPDAMPEAEPFIHAQARLFD